MKKRLLMGAVAALVVCILLWRFIPRSAKTVTPSDTSAVSSFTAISMVGGNRGGEPYFDIYRIDSANATSENIQEIAEILKTSRYFPDFRNLIPWGIDSLSAGRNYDGRSVTVSFVNGEAYSSVTFHSPTLITVDTQDTSGFRIYHPTNPKTLDKLVEYIETHGVLQQ